MSIRKFALTVVTDGSGNATAYTPFFSGYVNSIQYVADGTIPYSSGVDFAITTDVTGETVWTQNDVNASVKVAPRQATHSTAGVAALYAASGTAVNDRVGLSRDRLKFSISSGGNAKSGQFIVMVDDK